MIVGQHKKVKQMLDVSTFSMCFIMTSADLACVLLISLRNSGNFACPVLPSCNIVLYVYTTAMRGLYESFRAVDTVGGLPRASIRCVKLTPDQLFKILQVKSYPGMYLLCQSHRFGKKCQ